MTPKQKENLKQRAAKKLTEIREKVSKFVQENQGKLTGLSIAGLAATNIVLGISHQNMAEKLQTLENTTEVGINSQIKESGFRDNQISNLREEYDKLQSQLEKMKTDLETQKSQNQQPAQTIPQPTPKTQNLVPKQKPTIPEPKNLSPEKPTEAPPVSAPAQPPLTPQPNQN